jgi:glycosyltransferase involved in cell wall biosynthesis
VSKPFISIAIPCFNSARWLGQAIESALAQTWPEKEVIVVDDGSTDGSAEVARRFNDRIQLIITENRGGNRARNRALEAARGEWVQYLDADDFLEPEKIAQQFAESDQGRDADVLYSPVWVEEPKSATRELTKIDTSLDLSSQWVGWQMPQTGGALWRKSALQAIGGWKEDQPCCQEHELYLRALQAGLRFRFTPTPHAVYRIWSDDTVCRRNPRQVIQVKTALIDRFRDWLIRGGQWTESHRQIAGKACFEMARSLAKYDLAEAEAYLHERQAKDLLVLRGPSAPMSYQLAYRLLGFPRAERLAATLRR